VLAGPLYLLSGLGLRQAVGGTIGRSAQVLISTVGIGMIIAGLFPPDPAYGYPEGAPTGMPADLSTNSVIHGLAFVVSMLSWCALLVVIAVWFRHGGERRWAMGALITALALLAVPAVSSQSFGTVCALRCRHCSFCHHVGVVSRVVITGKGNSMRYMVLLKMADDVGAPPPELVAAMGSAIQQAFASGLMIDAGGWLRRPKARRLASGADRC